MDGIHGDYQGVSIRLIYVTAPRLAEVAYQTISSPS